MSTIALRARSQWRQTNARGYKACMVHPCMEARVLGRHTDGGGQHQAAAGLHLQSSTAPLPAGRPDASQSGDHCPGTRAWLGLTNQRAGEPRLPACRPVRAFKLARTSGDQRTRARVHSTAVVQTCVQCSAVHAQQHRLRRARHCARTRTTGDWTQPEHPPPPCVGVGVFSVDVLTQTTSAAAGRRPCQCQHVGSSQQCTDRACARINVRTNGPGSRVMIILVLNSVTTATLSDAKDAF